MCWKNVALWTSKLAKTIIVTVTIASTINAEIQVRKTRTVTNI